MVKAIGVLSEHTNGNDVIEVYEKVNSAIDFIRNGKGPRFFEFATYRWREHCGPNFDNDIGYRTKEEYLYWKKKDPIALLESNLLNHKIVSKEDIDKMGISIQQEIKEAFEYAESSPFPVEEEIFTDLYKV